MTILLHTPTNQLANSQAFYEQLGFRRLPHESLVLYTDGKALVEINPDRFARAGIKCYQASWRTEVDRIRERMAVTELDGGGYLCSDPSGVWIYLMESEPNIDFTPAEQSFSTLGNFMGLSLETTDFARSAAFYDNLGFSKTMGSAEQGFAVFQNGEFGISLMRPQACPHLFFNPSMTYFNGGKNLPVIERIRELGIPIVEEITHFNKEGIVDNIIIRDPGGFGFFVFND